MTRSAVNWLTRASLPRTGNPARLLTAFACASVNRQKVTPINSPFKFSGVDGMVSGVLAAIVVCAFLAPLFFRRLAGDSLADCAVAFLLRALTNFLFHTRRRS